MTSHWGPLTGGCRQFDRSFSPSKIKSRPAIGSELSLSVGAELPRLPSPFNEGTGRFRVARLLEQVHRIDERLYHPERERDAHEGPRERELRHSRVALRI